ncbi:N-acetylmuramoyl-L-alanine amidase [Sphingomonas laterariae]|uniref:N-acetylmuramoyl-L-alanine amidase n=1 Tax=Edaphosphingomonas laterariae TaxID=861865 RepID=A0A239CL60_9SPHN|nr:N-acetylmuramoyl-L-alanine amidase [Sphingomonas laterariae]SNS20224.1 N-acetylmuramoyl-L-alanine amidase [Sphingomonas laterariae]
MRKIDRINVHCTATRVGRPYTIADIDRDHKARGFGKGASRPCGYHYVIYADGTVHIGRQEYEVGANAAGYNASSIGIVYVGGLDANGKPADTRTPAQKAALASLVRSVARRYNVPPARILGHRDLSPDLNGNGKVDPFEWTKVCPCFDVQAEVPGWLPPSPSGGA